MDNLREGRADGRGGWGWEQIGFTFKLFLKPCISQIRLFAIAILLVGVLYGANLGPISIFQLGSCQKIEIQVSHSYVETFAYECDCEFGLFK